jgi:O-antigen/teichoic acid export membrane protein
MGPSILKLVGVGLATLANVMFSRLLTPEEFGVLTVLLSVSAIGVSILLLGMDRALIRFISQREAKLGRLGDSVLASLLILAVGWACLSLALISPLGRKLVHFPDYDTSGLVIGLVLLMGARGLLVLTTELFRGMSRLGVSLLLIDIIPYALLLPLLFRLHSLEGPQTAILTLAGAAFIPALMALLLFLHQIPPPETPIQLKRNVADQMRRILQTSPSLVFSTLSLILITQGTVLILGSTVGARDVALFGAASRISMLVSLPLVAASTIMGPRVVDLWGKRDLTQLQLETQHAAFQATIPSLLATAVLILIGQPLLSWTYGDFYGDAWNLLALLTVGQLVATAVGPAGTVLVLSGHERSLVLINTLTAGVALGIAWVGSISFGVIGGAAAATTGIVAKSIITAVITRRKCKVWTYARQRQSPT